MDNNRYELNKELAQMLKGGVIMDVTTPEQARIAQEAGACAVMALERIPADLRAAGGVSRMWRTACTMSPVPGSPLVRIMEAPSAMRRSASPKSLAPQTKGTRKPVLSI